MSNIARKKKHYERLINVLLNKTETCRGGNKHKKHIKYTLKFGWELILSSEISLHLHKLIWIYHTLI